MYGWPTDSRVDWLAGTLADWLLTLWLADWLTHYHRQAGRPAGWPEEGTCRQGGRPVTTLSGCCRGPLWQQGIDVEQGQKATRQRRRSRKQSRRGHGGHGGKNAFRNSVKKGEYFWIFVKRKEQMISPVFVGRNNRTKDLLCLLEKITEQKICRVCWKK